MNAIFENGFLTKYKDEGFYLQQKARILMYFLIAAAILISIITVYNTFFLESRVVSTRNAMRVVLIVNSIISLYLLKKGFFNFTANLVLYVSLLAMGVQIIFVHYDNGLVLSYRLYYLYIFVVIGAVFCSRVSTIVTMFLIFAIALATVLRSGVVSGKEQAGLIASFASSLVFISLLCFLLLTIVKVTLEKVEEGRQKEKENLNIKDVLETVQEVSEELSGFTLNMAEENNNLSERTTAQAASIEEVSAVIEETVSSIQQNTASTENAERLSLKVAEMAENSVALVEDAVSSINDINQSSKKVTNILAVLNEITFQTNLLALNASVEAARAGEMGRGFAVVAGEVRNLAQRSSSAAKEIETNINESIDNIEKGTELVTRSGGLIRELSGAVKEVNTYITDIASTSREQRQSIEQVNNSIIEMDKSTQENSLLVEKTTGVSVNITRSAEKLMIALEKT